MAKITLRDKHKYLAHLVKNEGMKSEDAQKYYESLSAKDRARMIKEIPSGTCKP